MNPDPLNVRANPQFISSLALFHPEGSVVNALSIGENRWIHFEPDSLGEGSVADLILWAPSTAECRQEGYLEQSTRRIDYYLAQDGVLFAFIPRVWRDQARWALKRQGLQPGTSYIHLPDWRESRYIVPLEPAPANYAFTNLFPTRQAVRSLAQILLRAPMGRAFLGSVSPWASFIAQRPRSRAPFAWLSQLITNREALSVLLSTSYRKGRCSWVLPCFTGNALPSVVAKLVGSDRGETGGEDEKNHLLCLGETAMRSGARVPSPGKQGWVGNRPVLLQNVIAGRSAAAILSGHPERISIVVEPVVSWLEAWNRQTLVRLPLTGARLERILLAPGRALADLSVGGRETIDWLENRAAMLQEPLPFVSAHFDLTVWNILLEKGSSPGIVDWSEASAETLPMMDLFYFLVDVVAVAHRIDHFRAFLDCFTAGGRYFQMAKRCIHRLSLAIDLPGEALDLCLHACFLHHAWNELRDRGPDEPHPFQEILRWLQKNRVVLGVAE